MSSINISINLPGVLKTGLPEILSEVQRIAEGRDHKNESIKEVLLLLLCTFKDVSNKYIHKSTWSLENRAA